MNSPNIPMALEAAVPRHADSKVLLKSGLLIVPLLTQAIVRQFSKKFSMPPIMVLIVQCSYDLRYLFNLNFHTIHPILFIY